MSRRLPLLCASNSAGVSSFYTEPCSRGACRNWKAGACTAGTETAELFARWFTPARDAALPFCPITERCAWEVAAVRKGEPGCFVRRLGLVCQHQAGAPGVDPDRAIWHTWEMADPDDPCWADG